MTLDASNVSVHGAMIAGAGTLSVSTSFSVLTGYSTLSVHTIDVMPLANTTLAANVGFVGTNVNLGGPTAWTGGNIDLAATLISSGPFTAACSQTMSGNGTFRTTHQFTRDVPGLGGLTTISCKFENIGANASVEVKSGELRLTNDCISDSVFTVQANAHLRFVTGQLTKFNSGTHFEGDGTVYFDTAAIAEATAGATVPFNTNLVLLPGATLKAAATAKIESRTAFSWVGGTLEGAFDNHNLCTLADNNEIKTHQGGRFTNHGSVDFYGAGNLVLTDTPIENQGSFSIHGNGSFNFNPLAGVLQSAFNNRQTGTLTKVDGTPTTFSMPFTNEGSLIIAGDRELRFDKDLVVKATGVVSISGGTIRMVGGVGGSEVQLDGGTLNGYGTIGGTLVNTSGTVIVSALAAVPFAKRQIAVQGDYTQGADGTLRFTNDAADIYGSLDVTATVTLAGTLEVALQGDFDEAEVISWGTDLNGTFGAVPLGWTVDYDTVTDRVLLSN